MRWSEISARLKSISMPMVHSGEGRGCNTAEIMCLCTTKPFCRPDETVLKRRTYTSFRIPLGAVKRGLPMFEFSVAFFAAFGASIFMAHAVEAYLSR